MFKQLHYLVFCDNVGAEALAGLLFPPGRFLGSDATFISVIEMILGSVVQNMVVMRSDK